MKKEHEAIVVDNVNITEHFTMTDYDLCLQYYFSTESDKQALAPQLSKFIDVIPDNVIDYLQQSHICMRFLCERLQGNEEDNCTLTASEVKFVSDKLRGKKEKNLTHVYNASFDLLLFFIIIQEFFLR